MSKQITKEDIQRCIRALDEAKPMSEWYEPKYHTLSTSTLIQTGGSKMSYPKDRDTFNYEAPFFLAATKDESDGEIMLQAVCKTRVEAEEEANKSLNYGHNRRVTAYIATVTDKVTKPAVDYPVTELTGEQS